MRIRDWWQVRTTFLAGMVRIERERERERNRYSEREREIDREGKRKRERKRIREWAGGRLHRSAFENMQKRSCTHTLSLSLISHTLSLFRRHVLLRKEGGRERESIHPTPLLRSGCLIQKGPRRQERQNASFDWWMGWTNLTRGVKLQKSDHQIFTKKIVNWFVSVEIVC